MKELRTSNRVFIEEGKVVSVSINQSLFREGDTNEPVSLYIHTLYFKTYNN